MRPIPPPWKAGTWSATELRPWSSLEGIIGDRYKRSEARSQIAEVKSCDFHLCNLTSHSDLARLRHKLITGTVYRAKMHRVRGIFLHFLAQPQNVIIHRPRARIIPVSPNVVQQLLPRQHALRVLDHELQHLELLRSQLHQVAFPPQL